MRIDLLTIREATRVNTEYLKFTGQWWLRSPGDFQDYASYVYLDGSVHCRGSYVNYDLVCVRPALYDNNFSYKIGEKVTLFNINWICVLPTVLLCNDNSFGQHRFDRYSSDYSHSEVKKYIDAKATEFGIIKEVKKATNH